MTTQQLITHHNEKMLDRFKMAVSKPGASLPAQPVPEATNALQRSIKARVEAGAEPSEVVLATDVRMCLERLIIEIANQINTMRK